MFVKSHGTLYPMAFYKHKKLRRISYETKALRAGCAAREEEEHFVLPLARQSPAVPEHVI